MARYLVGQIGASHYCAVSLDIRLYRRQPILYGKISCRIDWRQPLLYYKLCTRLFMRQPILYGKISCRIDWIHPLLYFKLRYQALQETANPIWQDIMKDSQKAATTLGLYMRIHCIGDSQSYMARCYEGQIGGNYYYRPRYQATLRQPILYGKISQEPATVHGILYGIWYIAYF